MRLGRELAAKCLALANEPSIPAPPLDCSEEVFQSRVTKLATALGWKWHHHTISKMSKAGWFDLFLVRRPRTIFAELKTMKGTQSDAQKEWAEDVRGCGHEVYCWRPDAWQTITAILRG